MTPARCWLFASFAGLLATCRPAEDPAEAAQSDASSPIPTEATDPTAPLPDDPTLQFVFEPLDLPREFESITAIAFLPNAGEFLVLEKAGRMSLLRGESDMNAIEEVGVVSVPGTYDDSDCGLISVALDPEFDANGFIYLGRCISATQSVIERYVWDTEDLASFSESRTLIMQIGDERATRPWHNVGALGFFPDGTMWALSGEKTVAREAQDPSNNLGAVLRFLPSRDPNEGGYEPWAARPFADSDVYVFGLRSPWTAALDPDGQLWVGDVGADEWEEVNLVREAGQNFGWDRAEGPCVEDCDGLVDPAFAYPHGVHDYVLDDVDALPAQGRVVVVGVAYDDSRNDRYDELLSGRVLVSDVCAGFVRLLQSDGDGNIVVNRHFGHLPHAHAWTQGTDGYIYAVQNGGCGSGTIDRRSSRLLRLRWTEVES